MKYLKTYESYKKDPHRMDKLNQVLDSLQDVFDEYGITELKGSIENAGEDEMFYLFENNFSTETRLAVAVPIKGRLNIGRMDREFLKFINKLDKDIEEACRIAEKRMGGYIIEITSVKKFGYYIILIDPTNIKLDESFYQEDVNAHLTSTVIDIFQELIDESDFEVDCFTVGYKTLRDAGVTHSDNDIYLGISRGYQEHEVDMTKPDHKSFTLEEILPYLERAIDFMESEGKPIREISYQYRVKAMKVKQVDVDTLDELLEVYRKNPNIENIIIYFGTGHFSTGIKESVDEEVNETQIVKNTKKENIKSIITDATSELTDNGFITKIYDHNWNVINILIQRSEGGVLTPSKWFKLDDIKSTIIELTSQLKGQCDARLTQVIVTNERQSNRLVYNDTHKVNFENAYELMTLDEITKKINEFSDPGRCKMVELIFIYNQMEY